MTGGEGANASRQEAPDVHGLAKRSQKGCHPEAGEEGVVSIPSRNSGFLASACLAASPRARQATENPNRAIKMIIILKDLERWEGRYVPYLSRESASRVVQHLTVGLRQGTDRLFHFHPLLQNVRVRREQGLINLERTVLFFGEYLQGLVIVP